MTTEFLGVAWALIGDETTLELDPKCWNPARHLIGLFTLQQQGMACRTPHVLQKDTDPYLSLPVRVLAYPGISSSHVKFLPYVEDAGVIFR
jgi:hypothetical protein